MARRKPIALTEEPGHLIRRAHQRAVATFRDTHGRDVTPVQYAILRVLRERPGIDQVTLADAVAHLKLVPQWRYDDAAEFFG